MVRDKQRFAEDGLAAAMLNGLKQTGTFVRNEIAHLLKIIKSLFDRIAPILRRSFVLRPIIVGKGLLFVIRIRAEIENVPLRESDVLQ